MSLGSLNPNSEVAKVWTVSSPIVTTWFVPWGALFTPVTLIVIVFGEGSTLAPPLAVPPLSLTWNVKLAYPFPDAFAAGVYVTSFPLIDRAAVTLSSASMATPFRRMTPSTGRVTNRTVFRLFAGLSFGSLNPKSDTSKV